jgi:dethiobiotin synthetase
MPGVFITGSGTDVGKTFVAAALIRHLRCIGRTVRAFKPVITGYRIETLAQSDCAALLDALGEPLWPQNVEAISPWRYRAAVGPSSAAALEGKRVDFEALAAFTLKAFQTAMADFTIAEGLGGVMVPFDAENTVLDLIALAAVPVIVVSGTYLGSLSHTLCALEVVAARGIPIAAIVVNESSTSTVTLEQTASALTPFAARRGTRLVPLRRDPNPGELETACQAVLAGFNVE